MSKLSDLIHLLKASSSFTFDTETAPGKTGNALDPHGLELIGIAFCTEQGNAFYLPIPDDQTKREAILNQLKEVFSAGKIVIGHNLKFDIQVMKSVGIEVRGQLIDTMVAHYLIDPDKKRHGLKELSKQVLNFEQIPIERLIGSGKNQRSMKDVPLPLVSEYACQDVWATYQIWLVLRKELEGMDLLSLFFDIECRLIPCLAEMEYHGVRVNGKQLRSYFKRADDDMDDLSEQIFSMVGSDFNIGSSSQVSKLFFDELDLLPIGERGKSGNYSVGKSTLKKMQNQHPVVPLIAKYKSNKNIINNYFINLPKKVHPTTGNIHAKFNQVVASTGRLSASEPNVQGIPKQNEGLGREIRGAFISVTPGNKIITADFSQIEVRVLAHCSKDATLVSAFRNGIDIHSMVAAGIFEVPITEITDDDPRRKIAKTVVFGINYGMTAKGLAGRLSEVLGRDVDKYEAEDYIQNYFDKFPGVKAYQDECCYLASDKGYAETILGRKRFIPDIDSYDTSKRNAAMRIAMNAPIQGSAADIIKISMIRIFEELQSKNLKTKIVLQVHDELVFDAELSELPIVLPMIKRHMENAIEFIVPMEVVIKVGDNWRDGEKWAA